MALTNASSNATVSRKSRWSTGLAAILTIVMACSCQFSAAHEVEGDRGQNEPEYAQRLARMRYIEPHKMNEGLRQRAVLKVQRAAIESTGVPPREAARMLFGGRLFAFPFPAQPELKSDGTVRTVTVLVDFNDHRAGADLPGRDDFEANIYGEGTSVAQEHVPYESVRAYYERASEGKVDVQGHVFDWHHFADERDEYEPEVAPPGPFRDQRQAFLDNQALFDMAVEVLQAQDETHDFAQYDNDNDGDIDLLTILYAGPRGSWGSFWWAYRWEFFVPDASTTTFDGKRVRQFVFQFIDTRHGTNDFNPRTLIHEMGHAFGLADYYDYDPAIGPGGGVGGLDMMHANLGNHCAFSRWLLDWISPEVVGSGPPSAKTLLASGAPGGSGTKAVAVFPGLVDTSAPASEMFIVENRHPVGNDGDNAGTPGSGVLIWHVDASVNASNDDFASDNSFTSHKLIRLVRADSEDDFGDNERATADVYFRSGLEFTADSTPSSARIDGTPTHVAVTEVSPPGEVVTAHVGITPPSPPFALAAAPEAPVELTSAVEEVVHAGVDVDALEELDKKLASATPEQIRGVWDSVKATDGSLDELDQATLAKQLILARWASKEGKPAVEAILAVKDRAFVERTYPAVMQAWANNNAPGAAAWYFADEQADLRKSKDLQPGAAFAEKLFCCTALADHAKAVEQLDEIRNASEIYGALKGLQHASASLGVDPETVEAQYEKLKGNKDVVRKLQRLQRAIAEIEIDQIDDQEQRKDIRQFLLEGIPE